MGDSLARRIARNGDGEVNIFGIFIGIDFWQK